MLGKFVEQDFAKMDRLAELHINYKHALSELEKHLKREAEQADEEELGDLQDEHYVKRVDAGLDVLQMIDYIILEACCGSLLSPLFLVLVVPRCCLLFALIISSCFCSLLFICCSFVASSCCFFVLTCSNFQLLLQHAPR